MAGLEAAVTWRQMLTRVVCVGVRLLSRCPAEEQLVTRLRTQVRLCDVKVCVPVDLVCVFGHTCVTVHVFSL